MGKNMSLRFRFLLMFVYLYIANRLLCACSMLEEQGYEPIKDFFNWSEGNAMYRILVIAVFAVFAQSVYNDVLFLYGSIHR